MTWTREAVRAELLKLFQQHAHAEIKVTEMSQPVAELSIDSLGVMEIIAEIEDRFQLPIPDEVLHNIETIADVARDIETRLERAGRLQK